MKGRSLVVLSVGGCRNIPLALIFRLQPKRSEVNGIERTRNLSENVAISLTDGRTGEGKAHTCAIA